MFPRSGFAASTMGFVQISCVCRRSYFPLASPNPMEGGRTYMKPAITPISTGTPTPTLTPMMSLLLTPLVFPSSTPTIPVAVGEEVGGTNDTGLPLVELIALIFLPKVIALTLVPGVAVTNVAFDPEGTTVTKVLVTVLREVDCKLTGQLMRPVERHCVAV